MNGKVDPKVLKQLEAEGRSTPEAKKVIAKSTNSKEKQELGLLIYAICENGGLGLEVEYKFHKTRRWKFDYAIPQFKIAIEYEGVNSIKSGHTTVKGFTKDCDKYNAAAMCGWKLLRYTALNYKKVGADLIELIDNIK